MAWTKKNISPIGLDLGARALRAIQLSSLQGTSAVLAASTAPTLGDQGDPAERIKENADTIRKLLRSGPFVGKRVVTALPVGAMRIKNLRLPCMPEEDLTEAVYFEAIDRLQSLDDQPEIRFYNTGKVQAAQGEQFELIVIAARGDVIRAQIEALKSLGLESVGVDFSLAATFRPFERFLKRHEDAGSVNAFLDIGTNNSRLAITTGSEISFAKVLDFGTSAFKTAIAKGLSVDAEEAEKLWGELLGWRSDNDGQDASAHSPALLEAIKPAVDQLSKEIGLCLRYFSVTFRGKHTESITCVGSASQSPSLLGSLSETLGVPARMGHPLRSINTDKAFAGDDRRSGQPDWATALGLAMKYFEQSSEPSEASRKTVAT